LVLRGDEGQLQQVVANLVSNAQDAMPEGGTVELTIEPIAPDRLRTAGLPGEPDEWAHIRVRDTGPGIAPEVVERMFEPLFTTKGRAGTGIGLSIVRQIVTAHGGRLEVDTAPGQGTTFHVYLRTAKPAAVAGGSGGLVDPWSAIRTVLLVEDDMEVAEGIRTLLETEGVECHWAKCGAEAVEMLGSLRPHLLILDLGLPDIDGVSVYAQASEAHPGLLTIFSTGHGDQRLIESVGAGAPVRILSKPWNFAMLTASVADLLRGGGR
ncbi:MAG: response regulator, partial [Acidobacteria bacterium]|nr:response regulator [Acidobacteriota bacterium]